MLDSNFSYSVFLSNRPFNSHPTMNFGWVDVEEWAGRTTNTHLIPSILFKIQLYPWHVEEWAGRTTNTYLIPNILFRIQ